MLYRVPKIVLAIIAMGFVLNALPFFLFFCWTAFLLLTFFSVKTFFPISPRSGFFLSFRVVPPENKPIFL